MRNYLLLASFFLSFSFVSAATVSPNPIEDPTYPSGDFLTITCENPELDIRAFRPDGTNDGGDATCTTFEGDKPLMYWTNAGDVGLWTIFETGAQACDGMTLSECRDVSYSENTFCVQDGNNCGMEVEEPEGDRIASSTAAVLIGSTLGGFGLSALAILAAIIGLGLGLLVFRWGWRKIRGVAGEERWYSGATGATIGGIYNKSGKVTSKIM